MLSPRLRLLVYLGGPREEGTRQGEMLRYFYAMWFRRIEDSGPVSKTERMRQTIGRPRPHSSTRRHNGYRCFITLNLGFWFRLWIFGQKPSTCSEIRNIDSLTYAPIRRYEPSNPRRCKGCVLANIQIRSRPQLGHNLFEDLAAYSRLPAQIYAKNPATPRTPGRPARNLNMLVQNGSTRVHDSGTWRRE